MSEPKVGRIGHVFTQAVFFERRFFPRFFNGGLTVPQTSIVIAVTMMAMVIPGFAAFSGGILWQSKVVYTFAFLLGGGAIGAMSARNLDSANKFGKRQDHWIVDRIRRKFESHQQVNGRRYSPEKRGISVSVTIKQQRKKVNSNGFNRSPKRNVEDSPRAEVESAQQDLVAVLPG